MATPVLFVSYRGVAVAGNMSLLKWKRWAVWDNVGRNKLIASMAARLTKAARKTLRELGVEVRNVTLPGSSMRRVVVLAETAEHARGLAKLLPDWEVLDAVPVECEYAGWNDEPDQDDDTPPGTIATLVYVARNGIGCDILVRATAGTGKLCWDVIRDRSNAAGTTPALIVDIKDEGGTREKTDAEIRRREYREQGLEEIRAVTKPKEQDRNM